MKIESFQAENFRIIQQATLDLSPGWNVIWGKNAQGKSALLESIYYLAFGKSFKNARDEQLIRFGASYLKSQGNIQSLEGDFLLEILANKKGKIYKYNQNRFERLNDYIGRLKIVIYSPDEISVVSGPPSSRRQFVDALFSQLDEEYLLAWQKYRHAVGEKNRVLKEFHEHGDNHLVSVYQEEFYERLIQLYNLRLQYVEEFFPLVKEQYAALFGSEEQIDYTYLFKGFSEFFQPGKVRDIGIRYLEREKEQGVSLWGPHLDDILFVLNEAPVRHYASQGQLKSLVLALKMASVAYIYQKTQKLPVLLIDDFSSELDADRLQAFLHALPEEMQVIFTTIKLDEYLRERGRVFRIEKGNISRL